MTPEERAKEMVNKFYQIRAYETFNDKLNSVAWDIAKKSAIIAADMLIESSGFENPSSYWRLVTQNIESQ